MWSLGCCSSRRYPLNDPTRLSMIALPFAAVPRDDLPMTQSRCNRADRGSACAADRGLKVHGAIALGHDMGTDVQ